MLRGERENSRHQPQHDGVTVDSDSIHRVDRKWYEAKLANQAVGSGVLQRGTDAVNGILIYSGSGEPADRFAAATLELEGNWLPVDQRKMRVTPMVSKR